MKLLPCLKIFLLWVVACLSVVSYWELFRQLRRNVCSGHWPVVWGFSVSPLHHRWHWFPPCRPYSGIFFYSFSLITHIQIILLHLASQHVQIPRHSVIPKVSLFLAFMPNAWEMVNLLCTNVSFWCLLWSKSWICPPCLSNGLHSICTGNASSDAFIAWLSHTFSFSWHN